MAKAKDLTGRVFGKLTAIEQAGRNKHGGVLWLCQCSCGNQHTVAATHLLRGSSTSCGCYQATRLIKHGASKTKLYQVYANIKERLYNPKHPQYKDYGGRGIMLCVEWLDPANGAANFITWARESGYREGLTIDREDVNGDYSPDNCRWVTMKTQCRNRRSTRLITYNGETLTAKEWSIRLGGANDMVISRLKLGWSEERAVSELPRESKRNYNTIPITYNGETLTRAEWARRLGSTRSMIDHRLANGWLPEDAVSLPKGSRKPKYNK